MNKNRGYQINGRAVENIRLIDFYTFNLFVNDLRVWLVTNALFFAYADDILLVYKENTNNFHSSENNISESFAMAN